MTLALVIPSRARPNAARAAAVSAHGLCERLSTRVVIAVDGDLDPRYGDVQRNHALIEVRSYVQHRGMVATLNMAVEDLLYEDPKITHVAFMGDDHRVRTEGWDATLAMEAGAVGVAYADDLNQGENLPTSVVLSAEIVRTRGYMAPPRLGHLYVDDYWRELGKRLGTLVYVPSVIIEHLHPTVGKGEWDDQYRRTNSDDQFRADEAAWRKYRDQGELAAAVELLRKGKFGHTLRGSRSHGAPGDSGRPVLRSTHNNGRW